MKSSSVKHRVISSRPRTFGPAVAVLIAAVLGALVAGGLGLLPTPASAPAPALVPSPMAAAAGGFAGAANTGPAAAGFTPTQEYTGPMTITIAGTVIENKVIPAGLRISADDVTVQGNIIEGATDVSWDQAAIHVDGARARVLDNTIRGRSGTDWRQSPVSGAKLAGNAVEFKRNDMYWIAGDGVSISGENAQVVGNWVHGFVDRATVHYDALHYPGADTTAPGLIRDNRVELWPQGGMTAALSFPDTASRIVVDHNVIAGGNYAIMGGGAGITISNNLFWTRYSPLVGLYGTHAHMGKVGAVTWTNNSFTADGSTPGATAPY